MLSALFVGLASAVIAWVFVCILCEPGEVFGRFPVWLEKKAGKSFIFDLLTCEKCTAGQLALCTYPFYIWPSYNAYFHILTISIAILTANFITLISNKIER